MSQEELIAFACEHYDFLSNWEKRRVHEWHSLMINKQATLSVKQLQALDRMKTDVEKGDKAVTAEFIQIATAGMNNEGVLYDGEYQFVEKVATMVEGETKLTKPQRAWLRKIESRVNKQGF